MNRFTVTILLAIAFFGGFLSNAKAGNEALRKKLKTITINKIKFEDAPVTTVFQYLKSRSKALDADGVGVNFMVILPKKRVEKEKEEEKEADPFAWDDEDEADEIFEEVTTAVSNEPTVTMDVDNMPLEDVVRYVCQMSGMRYKVEDHAVVILGKDVVRSNLELRIFSVDPRIFREVEDVQKFFEEKGVTFPRTR